VDCIFLFTVSKKNPKCDPNKKYGFDIKKFAAEGMKKKQCQKKL
jgi:hypothetical protein